MSSALSQGQINEFVIAAHSDFPKVKTLLEKHPELLNEEAEWFETAIEAASHTGQLEIAQYLLDQGAPLDICTAAVMGMDDQVAGILADDPEAVEDIGAHNIPVMFFPALVGNTAIAQRLLDAGADINAGEGGNTALHAAAGSGQVEMVRWLLDHDANPYALDHSGKMPIDLADANGFKDIVDILYPYVKKD